LDESTNFGVATDSAISLSKPCDSAPISVLADRGVWFQDWFRMLGHAESGEYLERISAWRREWRPRRVRFLLVAESHVAEQAGDVSVQVALPASLRTVSLPAGFCRLVYCLGYGESQICHPSPQTNRGTWQFWDIFGSIASVFEPSVSARMPRRHESSPGARLQWKVSVLNVLSSAGVWLEDASVIGIYGTGGARHAKGVTYRRLLRESFERLVWPEVRGDNVEQVWVVGRGVAEALAGLPMISSDRVISQPQDRNRDRYRSDLSRLLASIALIRG